jgi:hypothetical protein
MSLRPHRFDLNFVSSNNHKQIIITHSTFHITIMKYVFFILLFIGGLTSCKKNTTVPTTTHEGEAMLGNYLFGAISFNTLPLTDPDRIISSTYFS